MAQAFGSKRGRNLNGILMAQLRTVPTADLPAFYYCPSLNLVRWRITNTFPIPFAISLCCQTPTFPLSECQDAGPAL
jgi:hypothetical protein